MSSSFQCGSILEARDSMDWTALMNAVCFNKLEVVEVLLKHRANPNVCVRFCGKTPLMFAAQNGNVAMVEILLSAGALPTFTNMSGHDAEKIALQAGHEHVAAFLSRWQAKGPSLLDGPAAIQARRLLSSPRSVEISVPNTESACSPSATTNLDTFLSQIGLESFAFLFKEQQVDLLVFLSLTDSDLKECGVTKLGPRRKMTEAISRWHSNAPLRKGLEAAYALKLQVEMEELKGQVSEYKSVAMEMRKRLEECHDRCRLVGDHVVSAFRLSSLLSVPKLVEDVTVMSALYQDIFRLSEVEGGSRRSPAREGTLNLP